MFKRRARRRFEALDELVTGKRPRKWKLGLCFSSLQHAHWALAYKNGGGFGYRWMPRWLMHGIVKAWNPIACRIGGHYELDEKALGISQNIVCVNCSMKRPAP